MRFKKIKDQLRQFSENVNITESEFSLPEDNGEVSAIIIYARDGNKKVSLLIKNDTPDDYELPDEHLKEGIKLFNSGGKINELE